MSATAGPKLFIGLKLDRKKLEELTAAAIGLGMSAAEAASYVTEELGDELDSALVRLAPELFGEDALDYVVLHGILGRRFRLHFLEVDSELEAQGGHVSLIAVGLAAGSDHAAALVLDGPDYHATRLLHVSSGGTGATIRLPKTLAPDRWTIAVEDLSGVTTGANGQPAGMALVRMGIFTVARTARR
jgi:hypothetical protein